MNREVFEFKYSQELLTKMRTQNGVFNTERRKLIKKRLNEPLRYRVFKPILPEKVSEEDLKTAVDLAALAGCWHIELPNNPYINGLKRRASIYHLSIEVRA